MKNVKKIFFIILVIITIGLALIICNGLREIKSFSDQEEFKRKDNSNMTNEINNLSNQVNQLESELDSLIIIHRLYRWIIILQKILQLLRLN